MIAGDACFSEDKSSSVHALTLVELRNIYASEDKWGCISNAFTDLIRFKDNWYCVFRQGQYHFACTPTYLDEGKLIVLRSSDGKEWKAVAQMKWEGNDVRDAKFSVTADGKLMLSGCAYVGWTKDYDKTLKLEQGQTPYIDGEKCKSFTGLLSPDGSPWAEYAKKFEGLKTIRHQTVTWLSSDGEKWT